MGNEGELNKVRAVQTSNVRFSGYFLLLHAIAFYGKARVLPGHQSTEQRRRVINTF